MYIYIYVTVTVTVTVAATVIDIFTDSICRARSRSTREYNEKDAALRLHIRALPQLARPWPRLWSV